MPRIRKKTSKRGTTNKRARIQQKVAESRKKTKKAAKKNPQWKSKPKDPGIPNDFPYKDQILAEVAEERRQAAEEKVRKREEKKQSKKKAVSQDDSDAEGSENAFDGIASVNAKGVSNAHTTAKETTVEASKTQEKEVPTLINYDLPNLKSVIDQADVVLEVLDARDPLAFRSSYLEELVSARSNARILLVLNKIDTCPRESVLLWAKELRTWHPTLLFRSASSLLSAVAEPLVKGKEKANDLDKDALGVDSILECLGQWAQEKGGEQPLTVVVVGLTNVGKSSLVNSLLRKPILPTYKLSSSSVGPTTTTLPQEVTLDVSGKRIRFIDTPGLSWNTPEPTDECPGDINQIRARDILLRNKGRIDRLKDPTLAVAHIVLRSDTEDLMVFYNLPAFIKGDTGAFLSSLARSRGLIKKRGALDQTGASRIVLRDWSTGKFPRYTTPQVSSSTTIVSDTQLASIYAKDGSILSSLKSRKEMRTSGGLLKFTSGEVESRTVVIEEPWKCEDGDESSDDDVENEWEDVDEKEGQAILPPSPDERKRKRVTEGPLPSSKKVTFAPRPEASKQARVDASRKIREKPTTRALGKMKLVGPGTQPVTKQPKEMGKKKPGKVANVAAKPKLGGTDDAYDFSKFF